MGYWRKPPPETESTHRMGNLTIPDGFGAMGGNPLGPGEAQALYWWISLPFKMLFFIVHLISKGLIRLFATRSSPLSGA